MNKQYRFFSTVVLCTAILLGGCATSQVAKDAKGTGVKKVYDKPTSAVWNAMKTAVSKTGGEVAEENEQECSILAIYNASAFSWGERVGIFCSKQSESKTETEVVSKRAISVNITATDWTEEIYKILDEELK